MSIIDRLASNPDTEKTIIKMEQGRFLFLGAIFAGMVVVYLEIRSMEPMSAAVPLVVFSLMFVSLILIVADQFSGERISTLLAQHRDYADEYDTGEEADAVDTYDIDMLGVAVQMVWIVLYIVSINLVGFFTMSFAWSVAYILYHERGAPLSRRVVHSLVWSGAIVLALYVLFVNFLRVGSIWNFGFLP